jgi:hypothetical protein
LIRRPWRHNETRPLISMALLLAEIAKIISRERPVLSFQRHPIDRDRYIPVRGQISDIGRSDDNQLDRRRRHCSVWTLV